MQLFTRRFTKDILFIFIFIAGFYLLTHNPIISPKPYTTKGLWSIELMQQPLILGIAGHNYIMLRDTTGETKRELHGLATDMTTKKWKYVGTSPTDTLQVWEFLDTKEYAVQKGHTGIVLYQGNEEDTKTIWNKTIPCKDAINTKAIPYPPFGVNIRGDTENSNSVAYTLTLCMGLNTKHIGLITPGSTRNLLSE